MTNDTEFAGHRRLPSVVWVLVVARGVNRLGAFTLPFLAVVLTVELGAGVAEAGLVLTAFGVATLPSRVIGGLLADRLGRRATIVLGLVGCAVGQLWIAGSGSLWSAVPAVVLLGLAFEIYEPPSQAIIADVTEPADRPAAYGLLGAVMAVAGVVAGLSAAWLGQWDLRWLFVADAASCLACAVLVAVALPGGVHAVPPAAAVWRDRRLLWMLSSGTVFAVLAMVIVFALPLTLLDRGVSASGIGFILALSAITQVAAQPVLRTSRLRALDNFQAMALGYVVLAAGLIANGLAHNLPTFLAAAVVWSLGDVVLIGRALSVVAELAPEHARGRYLATYGLSWGVATAVAPLVSTQVYAATGPVGLWVSCAVLAVLLAALQPKLARLLRSQPSSFG
ncbi:MFS transporter [Kribbella sp. CA-293567]|uniref:MFS transporter n=1 Tax=Kribbella sp. CA-293567 TaxID=3002436 RepID=UPI0022DE428F|nr:MFS transporter [Kribbella sp. CA-293567]WBQ07676.1 MFS transporter [Kribbella sp. CA-293567]